MTGRNAVSSDHVFRLHGYRATQNLWASDIPFMSDLAELRHTADLFKLRELPLSEHHHRLAVGSATRSGEPGV